MKQLLSAFEATSRSEGFGILLVLAFQELRGEAS
jgi:hypothetical protein